MKIKEVTAFRLLHLPHTKQCKKFSLLFTGQGKLVNKNVITTPVTITRLQAQLQQP